MEQLVDKIVNVTFNELDDQKLPLNEKYGLVVNYKDVDYKFLIHIREDAPKLMAFGSGVLPETEIEKFRGRPLFKRQSWDNKKEMDFSTIFYDDPTRTTFPNLRGGWAVGSKEDWYLENIAKIFEKIFYVYNIENEDVVFYSSSMGGFMSIQLGTFLPKTTVWADIPQTDLKRYAHYKYLKKEIFEDNVDLEKYNVRLDCIELMTRRNYVPEIYLVMDISDYDLKNHFYPFVKRLYDYDKDIFEKNIKFLINPIEAHSFLKYEQFILLKNKYFVDTKFEDIEFFSVIRGTDIDVKLEKISDINTVIEDMEKLINEEKSNLE